MHAWAVCTSNYEYAVHELCGIHWKHVAYLDNNTELNQHETELWSTLHVAAEL